MLPDWAWNGPDAPDKLLLHVKVLRDRDVRALVPALGRLAKLFESSGRLSVVTGRPPRRVPSGYAHVFVGEDLSFLPGRVSAVAVPMTAEVFGWWEYRGVHVDTINFPDRTPEQMFRELLHELEHVAGRPGTHPPWTLSDTLAGLAVCAAAARRHRIEV